MHCGKEGKSICKFSDGECPCIFYAGKCDFQYNESCYHNAPFCELTGEICYFTYKFLCPICKVDGLTWAQHEIITNL